MDRHLKERLIGAAVLVAAAVVLIPEMLSGPSDRTEPAGNRDAEGVRTYTIDLQAPKSTPAPAAEPAPIAVQPLPIDTQSADADNAVSEIEAEPATVESPPAMTPSATPPRTLVAPVESERPKPSSAPVASVQPPPAGTWSVQVASLDARAKAEAAASALKARGFAAYVMEFESKGQKLYRVRVGPVADRAAADALLKQIKPLHPNAVVMQ